MSTATSSIVADLPVTQAPAVVQRSALAEFATEAGRTAFLALTAAADRLRMPVIFKSDLLVDNRRVLAGVNAPRSFLWSVHPGGTHLIRMDRMTDLNWGASAARLSGPRAAWFHYDGNDLMPFDRARYAEVALAGWSESRYPAKMVAEGQAVRTADHGLAMVRSVHRDGDSIEMTGHILHLDGARRFHRLWSGRYGAGDLLPVLVHTHQQSMSCASAEDGKH